jgi:hypothetical protein
MKPFGKEFYRALAIGFLIGCAGMALSVNSVAVHARAAITSTIAH